MCNCSSESLCEPERNRCCGWLEHPRSPGGLLHRQTPNRQTRRHPHTCAHICTQSCLAWKPIEAGPNINYLFFSRGLVTVIRVRGFLESGAHTQSNEENWPLYRALQAHLICSVALQVYVCVRTSVWVWLLLLQARCWERHTLNVRFRSWCKSWDTRKAKRSFT